MGAARLQEKMARGLVQRDWTQALAAHGRANTLGLGQI